VDRQTMLIVAFFNSANPPKYVISLTLYVGAEFSTIFSHKSRHATTKFQKVSLVKSEHNPSDW